MIEKKIWMCVPLQWVSICWSVQIATWIFFVRMIYEKVTRLAQRLGKDRRRHIERIRDSYREQTYLGYADFFGGWGSLPDYCRLCKGCTYARPCSRELGVNFIGGYSAIVSKGMTRSDELLIRSIPEALACTERICSSVNVGSTKTGINMDAVRLMGDIIKETARLTAERDSLGCAKLVVLCNAPDDNPFMAGAFHGVSEDDAIINVGVSGPGVVKYVLEQIRDADSKCCAKLSSVQRSRLPV